MAQETFLPFAADIGLVHEVTDPRCCAHGHVFATFRRRFSTNIKGNRVKKKSCVSPPTLFFFSHPFDSSRVLTFTWWGCCGLCFYHKPTELAHSFFLYSVLVFISVFMALSTVFQSINSPDNSPFSHSVLPVLFLPYWSLQLCISHYKSSLFSLNIIYCG